MSMFNRRKEDEYTPRPAAPTPTPVAPSPAIKESIPMSTMTGRTFEPETPKGSAASIGKSVIIKGQILSREDLYLDGELEGTVELQEHRLTIGPNGRVSANIKAREIVVIGTIQGNVEASDKIEIKKEARLVGDIRTTRIVIEDGAYFKGSIDIVKPEVSKQPPAPKPQSNAAMATAAVSGPATR
jgi:cytoskeletal protein CcmA (bactofilin family)